MRETHLHRRAISEIGCEAELEKRTLEASHGIALQYQQAFFDEPHVKAKKLLDRSEPVIRSHVNSRVFAGCVEHFAHCRINCVPVFVNTADVGVVLLAIKERMRLVEQVPKLMLEPIGSPIV